MQTIISLPTSRTAWKLYILLAIVIIVRYVNLAHHRTFFQAALIHTVVSNALIFLTGFCLLRRFDTLSFWKFGVYLAAIAGLTWTNYNLEIWTWDWIAFHGDISGWIFYEISPYIFFMVLTAGLLKYLFQFDTRSAILLGILLGTMSFYTMAMSLPYNPSPVPGGF